MAWSPSQYVKFEDERTRPARDLLAQVPLETVAKAIDLGCGPGNTLMRETAASGPWRDRFKGFDDRREVISPPAGYFDCLVPKAARVDVWHTVYNHPLKDAAAIVEWVRSTGLRPYLDRAGSE